MLFEFRFRSDLKLIRIIAGRNCGRAGWRVRMCVCLELCKIRENIAWMFVVNERMFRDTKILGGCILCYFSARQRTKLLAGY